MEKEGPIERPIYRIVLAPFIRLQEIPVGTGKVAMLLGVAQAVLHDLTFGIFVLLIVSGIADTIYGRRVAHALDEFDSMKAEMGLHSKIMGLILALLVRGFELWWEIASAGTTFEGFHTYGALAAAIAVTLFVSDLKSIEEKRMRFGQGPIPVLGTFLKQLDRIATALGAPDGQLVRRRDDNEAED